MLPPDGPPAKAARGRPLRSKLTALIALLLTLAFCQAPLEQFTVQFIAGAGGKVTGGQVQLVPRGGSSSPVTAVPDAGFRFDGWSGDHVGTENPLTVANVTAAMTVTANFKADGATISGRITAAGSPVANVVVTFGNGVAAVASDAAGRYSQVVPSHWSGSVVPSRPGWQFTPPQRDFADVTAAQADQDFIAARTSTAGYLKIHYINVQQGQSVFIEGPDGTSVLIDGGNTGKGAATVVPYLRQLGYPSRIDHIVISHRDPDHYAGISEVLAAGYTYGSIWDNGSSKPYGDSRLSDAAIAPLEPGAVIELGNGARITCVAADGRVIGYGPVGGALAIENDRSLGLLVQYGRFSYLTTGDMGGGSEEGTGRFTAQVDVETPLVQAIMPGGLYPFLAADGVELLHVAHHGSESSTNANFMNGLTPKVACIAVGAGQESNYAHPRRDVVENVLLARAAVITAPAALVLQTEEGAPIGSETSTAGHCVGDIVITTDGESLFQVEADGQVRQGPDERAGAGIPRTYEIE